MIMDGREVASKIKEEIKNEISLLSNKLTLCVVQVGDDEASNIYIKQKEKLANELGINFIHKKYNDISEELLEEEIIKLNEDKNITGIIIQLPIPDKYNTNKLINLIDPNKDVDGLTDYNKVKLYNNEEGIIPCTPLGILELLNHYNIDVKGKNIVIIGRSLLVSKPLFNLLLNKDATVTMCHSKTINLSSITKNADILISATGKPHLVTEDMIKDNAVIIDVGISRIDGKLCGDVDFENVSKKASYITPVPGGVGPMTVIMLMKNILNAYKKQKN